MKRYKQVTQRTKTPPNTKRVTRPTKFCNMFKIYDDGKIVLWNRKGKTWKVKNEIYLFDGEVQDVVNLYEFAILQDLESIRNYKKELNDAMILTAIKEHLDYLKKVDFKELNGKNVECTCKLDAKCHGDILLKYYC